MTLSVLQRQKTFAIALVVILLFSGFVRFWRLSIPSTYYFDEVYHAMTSKLVGRNDPRAFEWWNEPPEKDTAVDWLHPPLAKYTQGASMQVFGENSFGWRFSSAVFGVLTIAATALLAHISFKRRLITLTASFLAAVDGLLLAQSRIAMNDIHVTFALLITASAYIWYRQRARRVLDRAHTVRYLLFIGLLAGIAMGTKWSGVFILVPIGLFEGIHLLQTRFTSRANLMFAYGVRLLTLLIIPFAIYILSYAQMFSQGKSLICTGTQVEQGSCYCSQVSSQWVNVLSTLVPPQRSYFESLEARGGCKRLISHFSELHDQIWWYQTNLKATHPFQSRPWQWALDLRPVWTSVTYNPDGKSISNIYTAGNPVLFWGGLAATLYLIITLAPSLLRAIPEILAKKVSKRADFPMEIWFILTLYLVVWVPWTFSPRIMFFYHYAPAVPLLAILCAFAIEHLPFQATTRRNIAIAFCTLCAVVFVALFPIVTGYPMSQTYFDQVFKFFPSWK